MNDAPADGDPLEPDRFAGWPADEYREFVIRTMEAQIAARDKALEYQFGIGRWLLASCLVINGGALVALLQSQVKLALVPGACAAFVVGILLAMISGFATWANTSNVADAYDELIDYRWLLGASFAPQVPPEISRRTTWTAVAGIYAGALSVVAFVVGCVLFWRSLTL